MKFENSLMRYLLFRVKLSNGVGEFVIIKCLFN